MTFLRLTIIDENTVSAARNKYDAGLDQLPGFSDMNYNVDTIHDILPPPLSGSTLIAKLANWIESQAQDAAEVSLARGDTIVCAGDMHANQWTYYSINKSSEMIGFNLNGLKFEEIASDEDWEMISKDEFINPPSP